MRVIRSTQTSALASAQRTWGTAEVARTVQAAAAKCVSLRPRGTPRPTDAVYHPASGKSDPLRGFKTFMHELMIVRDSVAEADLVAYDCECNEVLEAAYTVYVTERLYSDVRRDQRRRGITPRPHPTDNRSA